VTQTLARVRAHLRAHFFEAGFDTEPDSASVTFLGAEPIEVLRFQPNHPDSAGIVHYVSLGCSRHPMADPAAIVEGLVAFGAAEKGEQGLSRRTGIEPLGEIAQGIVGKRNRDGQRSSR